MFLIQGDRVQIQQVFVNVIQNAFDSMLNSERKHIKITTTEAEEARLLITVADYGVGLTEADIDNYFLPFMTSKDEGLGMGLPICRSILDAHDGTISVKNNEGEGATVSITLPILETDHRGT